MRVIAGKHKGRRIECLEGKTIRPTSDMLRGAVFNKLQFNVDWESTNVADICCGTGAFGIEALSRGAQYVTFVDSNRESLDMTRKNLSKLGEEGHYELLGSAVENLPVSRKQHGVLYIDPPYFAGIVPKALKSLKEKNWIAPEAVIMCEMSERDKFAAPEGFEIVEERRYGNTKLVIVKLV